MTWPLAKIDLVNEALALCGDNLVAVADDGSDEWTVCSAAYESAMEYMLDSHDWKQLTTVVTLNSTGVAPTDSQFDTAFAQRHLHLAHIGAVVALADHWPRLTRVFLLQLGDDLNTARRLQYLARVSGGAYFRFDPRTQERQFSEMWEAVSVYAAGGEEAVKMTGGQAATLLLQHLKQEPMPIIEERDRVQVDSVIKE